MKIEVEISEQDLKKSVENYLEHNLKQRYGTQPLKVLIEEQVKTALIKAFEAAGFGEMIERTCKELAIAEIEKAAAKKVPGWVTQQMKEMLKYARYSFLRSVSEEGDKNEKR